MQRYLAVLDEEHEKDPDSRKVGGKTQSIQRTTSQTNPDYSQIHHGKKSGFG
jgi:hypothetical protein